MELSVRVLCRAEIARGFELAGLVVERVACAACVEGGVDSAAGASAAEALRRLARDPSVGVVLVEEALRRRLPDELVQRIDHQAAPLLVPFPSPAWEGRGLAEEYVLAILRQAVGYRVRPR
jgi:vacuolar-type H+-ATPase subunit F/Vma7